MADVLVSPRTGGTSIPLKIYSYLYAQKPIVATNLSAHTQTLTAQVALLTPPHAQPFANAILKLLQDKSLANRLGYQAKLFVQEKFDPDSYPARLDHIYHLVTKGLNQPTSCLDLDPASTQPDLNQIAQPLDMFPTDERG